MARGRAVNGSGTQPRRRSDGRWEVRYCAGYRPDGRPVRRSLYGQTAKEVAEKLREVTASIDANTYIEPQRMTLAAWLGLWLDEYCGGIKDSTRKTYADNVKNYLVPGLGAVRLCELQPHAVQAFINDLQRRSKPLAGKTIRNIHGTLSKSLAEAVRVRYIASNPAADCILPKARRAEIRPLEAEEIAGFLSAIKGSPSEALFFVALNTGMRLSELLGLRWSRVDLSRGIVKVDAQMLIDRGGGRRLGDTKNGLSRSFKVAPVVVDCLRGVQRQQTEQRLHAGRMWSNELELDLVFTDETGGVIPHNTVENRFRAAMRAAGISGHRFHDLRHTFATEAIRAGVDVKTVSEMLGHASVAFTLDVYAGVTSAMQDEAARRLQALFVRR